MISLLLLRHAKSSWDDPALEDFERPLAARGREAARRMGAHMATEGLAPDLILSSTAVRARQTLALVLPHLTGSPPSQFADALYLATPQVLLAHLRNVPSSARSVMLVGHNPGMHSLALMLTGSGEEKRLKALAAKFPTTALAVVTFQRRTWSKLAPAAGELAHFMTPKRL